MRNPLHKRFPRELRNNIGKYLGMFLMMMFAVAFTSGFMMAANSIVVIGDGMRDTYVIEDGHFVVDFQADEDSIADVEALGCTVYQDFYNNVPLSLPETASGQLTDLTVRLYQNRTQVNLASYAQGCEPTQANEIALDRVFCANHDLSVGDSVMVNGQEFVISGIMTLPDYQALFEKNSNFIFNAITFSVAQVTPEAYEAIGSAGQTFNYSFVMNDRSLDKPARVDIEEEMMKTLSSDGETLSDFIDYEDNQGIGYATDDAAHDQVMWMVLVIILVVITAFVFVVLTGATIEAESAVIGTLLASGWRKGELLRHYLALSVICGFVACSLGLVLGITIMEEPMAGLYYNSYSLPPYHLIWSWRIVFLTTIVPFLLLSGITLFGLMRKLGNTPLQFLRREVAHKSRRHSLHLPDGLTYPTRFRLRVLIRNLSHFITLFAGILFASLLLLFGTCMLPVVQNYASQMRDNVAAQYEYVLKTPLELQGTSSDRAAYAAAEDIAYSDNALDGFGDYGYFSDMIRAMSVDEDATPVNTLENSSEAIAQAEKFAMATVEIERAFGGESEEVTIYGIQPDSAYWQGLDIGDGKIVATKGLAEKTKLEVGQSVSAYDAREGEAYDLCITSATESETDMSLYMSIDDFNQLFGNDADYFNAYASNEPLQIDERFVASVITPDEMDKIADQLVDSMGSIMQMMMAVAVPVYLILVYLLTKTVIDRSARSISYMKVFGYRAREVNGLYIRPITYVVLGSLVVSMPIIVYMLTVLMKVVFMSYSGNFPLVIPVDNYVLLLVVGVVAYAFVAFLHVRRVKRVPLELAMKISE